MIQSKQVLEWQEQASTKARAEAHARDVLDVLQERIGALPNAVIEQVQGVSDVAVLQRWLRLAARATTLDQFLRDSGLTNGT